MATDHELLHEELTYRLQKTFYDTRNKYGMHHKEKVYHNALKEELEKERLGYVEQPHLDVISVSSGNRKSVFQTGV